MTPSVGTAAARAAAATRAVARSTTGERAGWLRAVAVALDAAAADLVPVAEAETRLPTARLYAELARTTFQTRLLADRLEEGWFTGAGIDSADPHWPSGPRPDLRRVHVPLGPVLVFAAGNFPFAFSVAGGDTISALAAGCCVIVKAHPGHPELSRRTARLLVTTLAGAGAPDGVVGLIEGEQAGRDAVVDPRIKAVAFTGSTAGGRALFDLAAARPDPVPFFGELGSTNPVVVTPRGWRHRADEIARGWAASVTLGSGQFCTKPGIVFAPDVDDLVRRLPPMAVGPMLSDRIVDGFRTSTGEMSERARRIDGIVVRPTAVDAPSPVLYRTTVAEVVRDPDLLELEMFGPAALLVGYDELTDLHPVIDGLRGQLTATVQGAGDADATEVEIVHRLAEHAGRVLWNDWPTGVSVTDAQQHGGPYPASTAAHTTSVGTASVWRFLRPVAFQNMPAGALPAEARDAASPSSEESHRE